MLRGTILQPWNWHSPNKDRDGLNLWQRLDQDAKLIKAMGFTAVWLPPSSQGVGGVGDVGYGVKDWYTLDSTKYGNKQQLAKACQSLKNNGIQIYHDQVHNHLMGGKLEKDVWCLHVKCNNKNEPLTPYNVWFQHDIPSSFPWLELNHSHFDAYHPNSRDCWAITGKHFDREAKMDPLMGCDLDFDNIDLVKKLEQFGLWFKKEIHTDGYRFDAVKHIRPMGTLNFLTAMRYSENKNLFAVGEFFSDNIDELQEYINQTLGQISLFDFALQRKLVHASREGRHFNMASLNQGTLTTQQPVLSVPFIHSHDDQPAMHGGEKRGEYICEWFISQAYAMILLRDEGYPMVSGVDMQNHPDLLKHLMLVRTDCTYGERHDRFDHNNTVAWAYSGGDDFDNSMAVVMTSGDYGSKWLSTRRPHVRYIDFLDGIPEAVTTNEHGWAEFYCPPGKTSIWLEESKYHYLKTKLMVLG